MTPVNVTSSDAKPAGTFKQLASATYDGLLVTAVLMLITALLQIYTHGEALTFRSIGAAEYVYRAALVVSIAYYFGSCWTRRGQTLGMKAWHLTLISASGGKLKWRQSAIRLLIATPMYLCAISGVLLLMAKRITGWPTLVFLMPLLISFGFNTLTKSGTLHDRWSGTRMTATTKLKPSPNVQP
jgi:uncharacterized RDD family membrane protein YckC